MQQMHTEAGSICYHQFGDGPAILLIHSFPHDHRIWLAQANALADQYRVITPDLPGFGQSPAMEAFTIESIATLLLSLVDSLGLQKIVVGGISMGGYITLAMAKRQMPKLAGLILADTKAEADTADARQNRTDSIHLVRNEGASHVVCQMLPMQLGRAAASERPHAVAQLRSVMASQTPAALVAGMKALRDRPDYSDCLAAIEVPSLLLFGQDDQVTPPHTAELLARSIRRSKTHLIADAGHISSIEQPARVTDAIRGFLHGIAYV